MTTGAPDGSVALRERSAVLQAGPTGRRRGDPDGVTSIVVAVAVAVAISIPIAGAVGEAMATDPVVVAGVVGAVAVAIAMAVVVAPAAASAGAVAAWAAEGPSGSVDAPTAAERHGRQGKVVMAWRARPPETVAVEANTAVEASDGDVVTDTV